VVVVVAVIVYLNRQDTNWSKRRQGIS
jgi:hypothetical protein